MANVNITDLTALTDPATADEIEIYDASASQNKRLALSYLVRTAGNGAQITGGGAIALGGYTLTVPATGTAALLATAQTFTAAQAFGTGASGGQVAIKAASASTIGLYVSTASSPTANIAEFANNGTTKASIATTGELVIPGMRSGSATINDDAVATLTPVQTVGLIVIYCKSPLSNALRNQVSAVVAYDVSANFVRILTQASTIMEGTGASSVLTGTTGTDGKFTVGAYGGTVYLENRIGASIAVNYLIIS